MSHDAITPTVVVNAIIGGLSSLLFQNGGAGGGGTGCVKTIKRYVGDGFDLEVIDRMITAGLPAILVADISGTGSITGTHQQYFEEELRISMLCCAGKYDSQLARMTGGSINPGVEDLVNWSKYYGLRAMNTAGLKKLRYLGWRWLRIEPEKYIKVVELAGSSHCDIYDDTVSAVLETLGIVHNPSDYDQLFLGDNMTPKTNEPATMKTGVVDL